MRPLLFVFIWLLGCLSLIGGGSHLVNLSTRSVVDTGANAMIAGFYIEGDAPKTVLLKSVAPSLEQYGVEGCLEDPVIYLYSGATLVDTFDSCDIAEVLGGLAPGDPREPAALVTLVPGAYTAIVSGKANGSGVALVEVYEWEDSESAEMVNLSTRAYVGESSDLLIAGFAIDGTLGAKIVLRALGPYLGDLGVEGVLFDPVLTVYNADGQAVAENDDWALGEHVAWLEDAQLEPQHSREAALVLDLPAGAYTGIVSGKNGETGIALIEVYQLEEEQPEPLSSLAVTSSLDFGDVTVGETAGEELVVENTGETTVNLISLTLPNGFLSSFLTGSLSPGEVRRIPLSFSPSSGGLISGVGALISSIGDEAYAFQLRGRGVLPQTSAINISGTTQFGSVTVGASSTGILTIENTGSAPLQISGISLPQYFSGNWSGVILPGHSKEVTLTFTPQQAGTWNGNLSVSSDAQNGLSSFFISGEGLVPQTASIAVTGTENYGSLYIGEVSTGTLTIQNTGTTPLQITGLSLPLYFSGNWSGTLQPGQSKNISITFAPQAEGIWGGYLTAVSNAETGYDTIIVAGTGLGLRAMLEGCFIYAYDGQYLGRVTSNAYTSDSFLNAYGTYGSSYSTTSIWNSYGNYGSSYSTLSAFNPYTNTPPAIYSPSGAFLFYLTVNTYLYPYITPAELRSLMN